MKTSSAADNILLFSSLIGSLAIMMYGLIVGSLMFLTLGGFLFVGSVLNAKL